LTIKSTEPMRPPIIGRISPEFRVRSLWRGVEAELEIDSINEASFLSVRHDELGAQFGPIDQKAAAAGPRVQRQIRAQLEPIGDAPGPFGDTVQGVVGRDAALEIRLLAADRRLIVVQLEAELPGLLMSAS
jgi:hypothetical protein